MCIGAVDRSDMKWENSRFSISLEITLAEIGSVAILTLTWKESRVSFREKKVDPSSLDRFSCVFLSKNFLSTPDERHKRSRISKSYSELCDKGWESPFWLNFNIVFCYEVDNNGNKCILHHVTVCHQPPHPILNRCCLNNLWPSLLFHLSVYDWCESYNSRF